MDRAFLSVEILEHILLHVEMRTLLVSCMRVSSLWASLINTSPSLQKKLFLAPCDAAFTRTLLHRDDSLLRYKHPRRDKVQNPILAELFPCIFVGTCDSLTCNGETLVEVITKSDTCPLDVLLEGIAGEPLLTHIGWESLPCQRNPSVWQRPEASWRQMLVQQPPVRQLLVISEEEPDIRESNWCVQVYHGPHYAVSRDALCEKRSEPYELGLRMGELYEPLEDMVWMSANTFKLNCYTSWWMSDFTRSRAVVLADVSRRANRIIKFEREDYERPGYDEVERVSTQASASFADQMNWIDEQYLFNDEDGADLIIHMFLMFFER